MPKRTDLKSILIIGAGPIVIGQACEFDYSGVQACKALREEGFKVILINSNPATIMTDPNTADVTYIEPITWQTVEKIIAKERPDAILPTMGGQTALNCALDLWKHGVLDKYNVELIGAKPEAIDKAEDRLKFKDAMTKIGLGSARSGIAHSMDEAWAVQKEMGFPTVIRPSFTLGGTGGGIAYNSEEFETICKRGLEASPTNELLIEESLLGWKEYEMEVVRDTADNCIIVCSIENLDPMGVHTGDSITVAPAQTLTDKEYQIMRNASLAVLREIGVETGGCPHTAIREDASINLEAINRMLVDFPDADIVFIESGGDNLAATFSPELSDLTIYVIDVAAGEKIPRKGGPGITKSDLFVINKTDLAPHVGADLDIMRSDTIQQRTTPKGLKPFVMTNLKTLQGLDEVVAFIEQQGLLAAA